MRLTHLGSYAMRKRRFYVAEVEGGWGVFSVQFYTMRGWIERGTLKAMAAMGIRRWDEATGELVGKALV